MATSLTISKSCNWFNSIQIEQWESIDMLVCWEGNYVCKSISLKKAKFVRNIYCKTWLDRLEERSVLQKVKNNFGLSKRSIKVDVLPLERTNEDSFRSLGHVLRNILFHTTWWGSTVQCCVSLKLHKYFESENANRPVHIYINK